MCRHCEDPKGTKQSSSNVIARNASDEAIQKTSRLTLDCFVTGAPRNDERSMRKTQTDFSRNDEKSVKHARDPEGQDVFFATRLRRAPQRRQGKTRTTRVLGRTGTQQVFCFETRHFVREQRSLCKNK